MLRAFDSSRHALVFLSMLVIYGLFSSMIPSKLGLGEAFVAILLGCSVYRGFFATLIVNGHGYTGVVLPLVFISLLILPLLSAIFSQNTIVDIIRDVIPLCFFFLPLFMFGEIKRHPDAWKIVLANGLAFTGTAMALRHFFSSNTSFAEIGAKAIFVSEGISLGHDPSVLFAAIYLLGSSILLFLNKKKILAVSVFMLSLPSILVILAIVARAPLALLILGACVIFLRLAGKWKNIGYLFVISFFIGWIIYYQWEVIQGAIELVLLKQEKYGNSTRELELQAVFEYVSSGVSHVLFGGGWGTLIVHPLAAGGSWSFVHNMFGYFLFKTGVVGASLLMIYLFWFIKLIFQSFRKFNDERYIILVAVSPPILINIFFEVGYKTLPFGLLLMLLLAILIPKQRILGQ